MAHLQRAGKEKHIHNRESESVNSLIPSQLRANSQVFIAFLEDYYKFTNKVGEATNLIDRIQNEHDIDFTGDRFLNEIKKEIAKGIPESDVLNNRQLYRRIVDYYYTRGSEDSATVFFRLFFDDTVTISYPKETLFKTSDAALVEHGYIEDTGEDIGKSVPFSTITGDFVTPKNTQIDVGLKPVRVDVQIPAYKWVSGAYRYNPSNKRWEKEGIPNKYQFFIFNRDLNRWEFVRQAPNFKFAFDNRGLTDEANPTEYASSEEDGFWSVFSQGGGDNWTFYSSTTLVHPDYELVSDETGDLFLPENSGDIRTVTPSTNANDIRLGSPVSTFKNFTTDIVLTDDFKENEYFCHNSNLTTAFWSYDYDQMETQNDLMVDLEFIREEENFIKYPLTHQVRDNNSSTTYGHMFVNETNFGVKGVHNVSFYDISNNPETIIDSAAGLSRRLRIDLNPDDFIEDDLYVLTGTITLLPGTIARGEIHNSDSYPAAGTVVLSSATEGFTAIGSRDITRETLITLPDDDANNRRGLSVAQGKTEVGDFEVILRRDTTSSPSHSTAVLMFVSSRNTDWQIDNLKFVKADFGNENTTIDDDANIVLGDNDIREIRYHKDYHKYKQLGFSFSGGDHQGSIKTAYRSLPFNDVTDTHKSEASAIMANSGSSVTEGIRIHREINMLRNVSFFDIIDVTNLSNGRPRSARNSAAIAIKEASESSYKIERDFLEATVNETTFDVTDGTPPELTLDAFTSGTLEVGMGVSGSGILRGSKIETIVAQDTNAGTATITISPQYTNVVKVTEVKSTTVYQVRIIDGATETLAGTIGTDLYILEDDSLTAVSGTPTVAVSNVVNDNGIITCDITFSTDQSSLISQDSILKCVKKHAIQDNTQLKFTDVKISLALQRPAISYDEGDGLRTYLIGYRQKQLGINKANTADHNPNDTFQLATAENNTTIFAKDKDDNLSVLVEAETPTRYRSDIAEPEATKISIPDRTIISSNAKPFGISSNGADNAVLPLNAYGKEFLTFNYRSETNMYLTGYALESTTIDFYEIEIPPALGWGIVSDSYDYYGENLFKFGPDSPATDTVVGPAATLINWRKVDGYDIDPTIKTTYNYEVLVDGDYSGAINEVTGFITRNGKKISNSERTNLRVGDIFVGQPGPTGKHKFKDGQLVKIAPSETMHIKEGEYFSLTPRSGASYRYAFSDIDDRGEESNRYYFYAVKSTGNIVLGQQSGHHDDGNTSDNLVITPSTNKGLSRMDDSKRVYAYSLEGLRSPAQSGNGRVSDGPQIQTAQNYENYTYTQEFVVNRAKPVFNAEVDTITQTNVNATIKTSGVGQAEGNPTSTYGVNNVGALYTNQYLRVAFADLNGAIDSTAGDTINIDNVKGHIPNGCRVDLASDEVTSQHTTPITVASVTQTNAGGSGDTATITLSQDLAAGDNKRIEFYVQITGIADRGTAVDGQQTSATITTDIGFKTSGNANGLDSGSIFRLGLRRGGLVSTDANRFAFKSSKAPGFTEDGRKVDGMVHKNGVALDQYADQVPNNFGVGITHRVLQNRRDRLFLDAPLENKVDSELIPFAVEVPSATVLDLPGQIEYAYASRYAANRLGTVNQLSYANNYNPNDDNVKFATHPTLGLLWYQTSASARATGTSNTSDNPKLVILSTEHESDRNGTIKVGQRVSGGQTPANTFVTRVYHQYKIELTTYDSEGVAVSDPNYNYLSTTVLTFQAPAETYTNTDPLSSDRSAAYIQVSGEMRPIDGHYFESHLPIMAQSYGDGAGSDGTHYMPLEKCKDTYVVTHEIRDWTIVTTYANTIKVYYWYEAPAPSTTKEWRLFKNVALRDTSKNAAQVDYFNVDNSSGPGDGDTSVDAVTAIENSSVTPNMWKFEGDKPFALWLNDESADEELVYGLNRNTYNTKPEYNFYSSYETRKGRLSDVNKLHDGVFNQEFSYGVNTGVSLDKWETQYRKLVHPAGLKFFALMGIEPQVLRTAEGNSEYALTEGGDWVDNLALPVGQHSPTFQPGWLDEVFTSVLDLEPQVLAGAGIMPTEFEQILASTYALTRTSNSGITSIQLTTKFVETLTSIIMKTTDLASFTRNAAITTLHWNESDIATPINQGLTGNSTRKNLAIVLDESRVDDNNNPIEPFYSQALISTGGLQNNRRLEFRQDVVNDVASDIIIFKLLDGSAINKRIFNIRNYGLRSGRKYRITGSYKVTENTLTTTAHIGMDISDGYVQENEVNREGNNPAKGIHRVTIDAGQTNTDFVPFSETTGTYWHFANRTSIGRNNIPGVHDFIDFGLFTPNVAHTGAFTVEFKDFKIEEYYPENEVVLFTDKFDTRVPQYSTNPQSPRSDSRLNFTSWHNPISNIADEDFENYQPLNVPNDTSIVAEVTDLKPVSNDSTIVWNRDAAEKLYKEVGNNAFPTDVNFTLNDT